MTPIVRPKRVKSTRPLAGARRTYYSRPISMTRPRISALRSAKGRHYRALYVPTSTWSTHSRSPETARTMSTRAGESFMTSNERGWSGACVHARANHRRIRRIRTNLNAYPIATRERREFSVPARS